MHQPEHNLFNPLPESKLKIHSRENLPENEAWLEANKENFQTDCWRVLQAMLNGERLNYKDCINRGLTGDIRARCRDLRKFNEINVSDNWVKIESGRGYKEYFLMPEEIIAVSKRIAEPGFELKKAKWGKAA